MKAKTLSPKVEDEKPPTVTYLPFISILSKEFLSSCACISNFIYFPLLVL